MKAALAVASMAGLNLFFSACSSDQGAPQNADVGAQATGTSGKSGGPTTGGVGGAGSSVGGAGTTNPSAAVGSTSGGVDGTTSGSITGGTATVGSVGGAMGTQTTGAGGMEMGGVSTGGLVNPGDTLETRLHVTSFTTPEGVHEGDDNWRIWGRGDLVVAPVFAAPLANCGTLVCYTTESGNTLTARVAMLDASDALVNDVALDAGYECRGLAAAPDGSFAALLWDDDADEIYVARYDVSGSLRGAPTQLVNSDNTPDDFGIGESRLEYGAGQYGAYYHVHSDSGHEGDTLKWVDAESGAESTEWSWGCSHSMSNLLRFHPGLGQFLPACVTDCYPGTGDGDFAQVSIGGIYLNHNDSKVMDVAAGCNGDVAGELGGVALAPGGFKLVFNAHQAPTTLGQNSYNESTMNQDIGFANIGSDLSSGAVVWLTDSSDIDEADSTIARWEPAADPAEQYVVGWSEPGESMLYRLARIDADGNFIEGPVDVSAQVRWGRRDDPFRQHQNKDVVWAYFESAGSTTLNLARLSSGNTAACASF